MIVLGVDGMDALPNLDRLRQQGSFQRLATTIPPQSPVAWSTVITGMDPGGHGIYDFVHRDPATRMPFSSMAETAEPGRSLTIGPFVFPLTGGQVRSLRRGRAFWQILAEDGVPGTIVRMPANFPPAESKARSLAGMGTPDMRGTFGTFTYFTGDPQEQTRQVPGGRIVRVNVSNYQVELPIDGPVNTFRKERPRASCPLVVHLDPSEPVARLDIGETQVLLKEGEWSGWQRAEFPLIPGLRQASGIFRVYLRGVRPVFRLYVSPVNIDPEDPELPISTPSPYSRELARAVGLFYTQGIAEDTAAVRAGVLSHEEFLAQSRLVMMESLRLFQYELEHFETGLLFHYFSSIDQNSHILWEKYDGELLEIYRAIDRAVGRAREKMGEDGTLLVLSDHGFSSFRRAVHLNTWLLRENFLALDEPQNTGNEELFAHVDWSRTQAYALGLNGLYLNLAGREPGGIVLPGPQSDDLERRLTERLLEFRDPETGDAVVGEVYSPRKLFHGSSLEQAPDLIVGYERGYRASWQTALGAVPAAVIENNTEAWIGDHCIAAKYVPGVLFANRKARLADPQLYDVTVTILKEFGISPAGGMIGRPIY
ncbi:MAG: alkaline phosphatase family protein [Acidobacteria bacterium]|nr:alkaline phosphatase family protein [Acidobacteriota bacterium]